MMTVELEAIGAGIGGSMATLQPGFETEILKSGLIVRMDNAAEGAADGVAVVQGCGVTQMSSNADGSELCVLCDNPESTEATISYRLEVDEGYVQLERRRMRASVLCRLTAVGVFDCSPTSGAYGSLTITGGPPSQPSMSASLTVT